MISMSLNPRTYWIKRENCERAEERHQRLSQMRKRKNNHLAEETVEQRDQRLQQMRERSSQRLAEETNEQRTQHLHELAVHRRARETDTRRQQCLEEQNRVKLSPPIFTVKINKQPFFMLMIVQHTI